MSKSETFKVAEPKWSKAISRVKWIVGSFFKEWKAYNFRLAYHNVMWWVGCYGGRPSLMAKHLKGTSTAIDGYFEKHFSDILAKYTANQPVAGSGCNLSVSEYPLWVFWWQGEEAMPFVVRSCYLRLKRNNPNLRLLTSENVRDYVALPEVIYDKVKAGKISYTHFSDILRLTLLAERGGMWIDATCFNPYPIPDSAKQEPFYSPRVGCSTEGYTYFCNSGGWRSWNLGTCQVGNPIFLFCRDMSQAIVQRKDCVPNYFFVDMLLNYAFRHISGTLEMFQKMPQFNTKCADLFLNYFNANRPYSETEYLELIKDCWIFKLTYKTIWQRKTASEKATFYDKLFPEY